MKKLTSLAIVTAASVIALSSCSMSDHTMNQEHMKYSSNQQMNSNSNESMGKQTMTAMSDTEITTKVKSKFISQSLFTSNEMMSIHVKTMNGVVYLTGRATDHTQAQKAIEIAQSVDGVKKVVSKVMVKRA